jgi:hypothetical protein
LVVGGDVLTLPLFWPVMMFYEGQKLSLRFNKNLQLHTVLLSRDSAKVTKKDISLNFHFSKLIDDAVDTGNKISDESPTFLLGKFCLIFGGFHEFIKRDWVILVD